MGRWVGPGFRHLRLADAVPVFQRAVEIPLKKINRPEKVVCVCVVRPQLESLPQTTSGLRIVLPPERNARQFNGKPWIARCQAEPGLKGILGLRPPLQSRQRCPVVKIKISGARRQRFEQADDILPALLRRQMLDLVLRRGDGTSLSEHPQTTGEYQSEYTQRRTLKGMRRSTPAVCGFHWMVHGGSNSGCEIERFAKARA